MEQARRDELEPYVTRDGSIEHLRRRSEEVGLVALCACSPPYSHEDTVLLEGEW